MAKVTKRNLTITETVTNIFTLISSVRHVEIKNLVQKAQTYSVAMNQKQITMETITTETVIFNYFGLINFVCRGN